MLKVGNQAPNFSLLETNGTTVSLKDFRGKKVVLFFYPKDSTPGCTREACDFQANLSRLKRKGVIVLGVSADGIDFHKKFKQRHNLTFPLLSDPKKHILRKYGVWKRKQLYGRSFMGIERTTFLIDEHGRILRIFQKIKVNGHVDEVISALKEF